jgi:dihydroflavonol-4-reductase
VGKRTSLNRESILLTSIFNEMDNSKARTELGWQPRPMKESIADAVEFYLAHP